MIPGQRKPLILCPDNNRCQECPYPEYRDKHQANQISYEQMIELGEEIGDNSRMIDQLESKMQYREIRQIMDREDSLITQVFEMKAFEDIPVKEIAAKLGITERQVYYLHSKALAIGQKYNQD